MTPPPTPSGLTPSQAAAVAARGNVLVMAGAGTGKTHTLIQRILACLRDDGAALDELLVVTFTEAAAAEMRQRLRRALDDLAQTQPDDPHSREQLALFDTAHIGTLHSFCLKLVREHFHELGLDPDLAVLETGEARLRAEETLEEILQGHYGGESPFDLAVQSLIQIHGGGRDEKIRQLVLRLHNYAQTRPDAEGWLTRQSASFAPPEPVLWTGWLLTAIAEWRAGWLPRLEQLRAINVKAAELLDLLRRLFPPFTRIQAAETLTAIQAASEIWPPKQKTILSKPLKSLFEDAEFFGSLGRCPEGKDPLLEDWDWTRHHLVTLLELARAFSHQFSRRKLEDGVVDFHDLEQFALTLLWDFTADQPTPIALRWQERLKFVFVDEYQDINAAQDKIISALSRTGEAANRFLVGDVKQSIYRFRLADPKIFRAYARDWRAGSGQTLALSENFRSREGLLTWVNQVFEPLMREEFGGVNYDAEARLQFGSPATRPEFSTLPTAPPRAELLLLRKPGRDEAGPLEEPAAEAGAETFADLDNAEKEARLLARRLVALRAEGHEIYDGAANKFRPVTWRDMAVLLRAPGSKAEIYAREFDRAGIPLVVERGGFYQSAEISDLLSVLQLLDNPLQDVPTIAVLRSPLVGLSLDELAQMRLAVSREHFWTALNRSQQAGESLPAEMRQKIATFLERYERWRRLARQAPLVPCLETVLLDTHYQEWLGSRPRGAQRQANVRRLLSLAEQFDQFQQQGLSRFLKFIEVQQAAEVEPEVALVLAENAVRLMSIHQSKGLEFPVVALADLSKAFNTQDRRAEIIFDETYGLCPRVKPPQTGRSYPSLPHWLAQQAQRREAAGEELRLLYVALTRARDTLILTGSVTDKKWADCWVQTEPITAQRILAAISYADWIGLWFAQQNSGIPGAAGDLPHLRWRLVEEAELAVQTTASLLPVQPMLPPLDAATFQRLQTSLTWHYPFAAATREKAKTSVTALRRQVDDLLEDEAQPLFPEAAWDNLERRQLGRGWSRLTAAEIGTAHHKFLQHVDLDLTNSLANLHTEAHRLASERVLSPDERAALDLPAIAAFWLSGVGAEIREQSPDVRRELPFTARFTPAELAELLNLPTDPDKALELAGEFVVIQGVADLIVLLPKAIWLVDFKTDALAPGEIASKTTRYAPQVKLYAAALAKIYNLPVARRWLHFLAVSRTVEV